MPLRWTTHLLVFDGSVDDGFGCSACLLWNGVPDYPGTACLTMAVPGNYRGSDVAELLGALLALDRILKRQWCRKYIKGCRELLQLFE